MDAYQERFGEPALDDICTPLFMYDPKFLTLLHSALDRGRPLTQDEVSDAAGGISWNW